VFCPVCKAEYREGFYRCPDCEVDLVTFLPPQPDPPPPETDDAGADSVVLCQEDDPARLTAILSALQGEGVTFYDYPIHEPQASYTRPFPKTLSFAQSYEIRVSKKDLSAAQRVLAAILEKDDEPSQQEAPESDSENAAEAADVETPEVLGTEEVTAEVWSGEDANLAQFLTEALRENGIATRRENDGDDSRRIRILVAQETLARAREVVREIAEGEAPT
jgi:hypothetical protein